MTRIFTNLAILNAITLVAAFGVGIVSWLLGAVAPTHKEGLDWYLIHFVLGLSAAMLTLLVHCLIFTYSLGTGRWVREVAGAYGIADEPYPKRTRELKRSTFPPALFSMLSVIAAAAAGAGVQLQHWPWFVHGSLAVIALLINFWAYGVEYRFVTENATILEGVMREVNRIREERGLPSNEQALAEEGKP